MLNYLHVKSCSSKMIFQKCQVEQMCRICELNIDAELNNEDLLVMKLCLDSPQHRITLFKKPFGAK